MSTYMRNSSTIAGFIQCSGGKLEEAKDFNVFSSFIACSNRNRSALARSSGVVLDCIDS